MPSAAAPSFVRFRFSLELPAPLLDAYTDAALKRGISTQDLIAERLAACQHHTSHRPLYLSDSEREECEQLLGGGIFSTSDDMLRALRNSYTVTIGGANIKLDPQVYTLLKDRSGEMGRSLREMIVEICTNALSDYATGGH